MLLSLHTNNKTITIMKIKVTKTLKELAEANGMTAKQLSENIVAELENIGFLYDNETEYGKTLIELAGMAQSDKLDVTFPEFVDALIKAGIKNLKNVPLNKILSLVVMGDGNCPDCGNEVDLYPCEYRNNGGDGIITPNEDEPTMVYGECDLCGHIIYEGI